MNVDIYQRRETNGKFSYLAVPHGEIIPDEVTNTDWEAAKRNVTFNGEDHRLNDFLIDDPIEQITEKGYAITSIKNLTRGD